MLSGETPHFSERGCLAGADDLLLLSSSDEGLQNMISKLSNYSLDNGLRINIKKTKAMIFNKSGRFYRTA